MVPHIVERAPDLSDEEPKGTIVELLDLYLFINRELRRRNSETIGLLAHETTPTILWDGPFQQLTNSQVESGFADHRTYFHSGTEIDDNLNSPLTTFGDLSFIIKKDIAPYIFQNITICSQNQNIQNFDFRS